ncbi:tyrosine-type recombinase/integrase [Antribacter sp. KLBMP9083]|uniref:Tyrosine-type recombinase/integrase n=1 Tax=Antribacter soli TaxID=2910976 RepID=A0AA41U616_9MICO|nr:tyrosine-type recombinase/integrase [Antribacter soli]MCF4119956.1 tyrosine-type recombinase/integrase [Antribacter soli]
MASIKKRPDGKWRARYRDANGHEHARHFDRKQDAQAWLDEVTATIVTGTYADPRRGRLTFGQWWDDWSVRQVWVGTTVTSAGYTYKSLTFTTVPMRLVRPSHIEQWIKKMTADGIAASTIKSRMVHIRSAFRAAVRDKVIGEDPTANVTLPRIRRPDQAMQIPTVEEVGAALAIAPDPFAPVIAICAFAGLRIGEVAGLQVRDVDFLRRTIKVDRQLQGNNSKDLVVVPPKYESYRTVHVPEDLTTLLAQHIEAHGTYEKEEWLLQRPTGGNLTRGSASASWRAVRRAVPALEPYTLHDLRHFYASGLIASGCDVVTVQRALGHATASMTLDTYSHLWPKSEDRTRKASADLMTAALTAAATHDSAGNPADSLRTAGQK